MKNISSVLLISALAFNYSCTTMKTTETQHEVPVPASLASNPFMKKSTLQYEAPEFDKIKDEHFKPAFDFGLKQHDAEIIKIADNPAAPTFENTIVALERSGEVLKRAMIVFSNLTSANTNPTLQALDEEYAPVFAAHSDKMYLNENLYKRIQAITDTGLDAESKRLLRFYKQNFEIAGANLSSADKEKLKQINQELASLSTQYSNKLLEARKQGGVFFSNAKELDGLSADEIAAAAADAKNAGKEGQYLLALQNTTQQPLLQNLKNRATREKLFKASWTRAEKGDANDTRETIEKLAALRLKKAQVLGKKSFAEWKLQDQMAKTPEAATCLLYTSPSPRD